MLHMSSTKHKKPARAGFTFAAIDPYVESNITLPTEKYVSNRDMM